MNEIQACRFNTSLFVVFLLVLVMSGCVASGRLAGKRSLSTTAHGYAIIRDIARVGQEAQRFEVRAGDCGFELAWNDCDNDRERSEIALREKWLYGENRWIGFSLYLPVDFKTSPSVKATGPPETAP